MALHESGELHPSLRVGRADGPLEREADRVARRVVEGSVAGSIAVTPISGDVVQRETPLERHRRLMRESELDWEEFVERIRPFLSASVPEGRSESEVLDLLREADPDLVVRFAQSPAWTNSLSETVSSDTYGAAWAQFFEAAWIENEIQLIYDLFDRRYGINLRLRFGNELHEKIMDEKKGRGGSELGRKGLLRAFLTFSGLPTEHVREVEGLAAETKTFDRGVAGRHHSRIVDLSYDLQHIDERDEDDMFEFDRTLAHEVAHAVDDANDYSGPSSGFRDITGWEELDTGPDIFLALDEYVEDDVEDQIDFKSDAEREVAETAALKVIVTRKSDPSNLVEEVRNRLKERDLDPSGNDGLFGGGSHRSAIRLAARLEATTMLQHFYTWGRPAGDDDSHRDPWYAEPYSHMGERQVHQGYEGRSWFSYPTAERSKEIIREYQFRTPGEEFAEVYAEYYLSDGETVPSRYVDWFENNVVGTD